ncbi:MAG: alpha-2-macroglobulin, partial [Candidatus Polarisedimenticolia bacterium]
QDVDERSNVDSWSSDERTTAIALLVMADDDPGHPYVGKIARWLASARDKAGQYRNTQESAFSLLALTELLRTKEKDVPDFAAEVSLGGAPLARETVRGRSLEARRAERPLADMLALNEGTPLAFSKQGAGVLYYSASLRYAPTKIDLAPLDRGIAVQRWFETWDGAKATSFKAGDILRLKVRLATSAERRFVAVSAPLPAGLEVVDPSFATTAAIRPPAKGAQEAEEAEGEGDEGSAESPWDEWFWSPWTHEEMRDDRVLAFADELPVGTHTLTVVLRATTAGTFQLPAARAEEMYTPEVFGRSEGGSLVVAPPAD